MKNRLLSLLLTAAVLLTLVPMAALADTSCAHDDPGDPCGVRSAQAYTTAHDSDSHHDDHEDHDDHEAHEDHEDACTTHSWDAGCLTTKMTDTCDGHVTYTCSACGQTKDVTLPAGGSPFVDVQDSSQYYYSHVLSCFDSGIVCGTSDFEFSPGETCTRAQLVTFLYRLAGKPTVDSSDNPFQDVKAGAYYYDAVLWGYQNEIVYGTSADEFSPDATVTRAQTVTFLYRYAGKPAHNAEKCPFTDVPDTYYTDAVLWGCQNGIVYGTDSTTFSPNAGCTRAQAVTFLCRCKS